MYSQLQQSRIQMKAHNILWFSPLPPPVNGEGPVTGIKTIMHYLDGKSLGECRLVCRTWKQLIDEEIGLILRLNERKFKKENGKFCRSVAIERLSVEHLDRFSKFVTLKYPEKLQLLSCVGPVNADWLKDKILVKCLNLRRIEFSGRFLQSQELTTRLGETDEHGCTDLNDEVHHITLPHLKSLIIFHRRAEVTQYLLHVNGTGPLQAILGAVFGTKFQAIYLLKQMIDINVSYILSTIRSPALSLLYIFVDSMDRDEEIPHPIWSYYWKKEPLKNFLIFHRNSLRHLYLPCYNGNVQLDNKPPSPVFPCELKTFEVAVIQKGNRKNGIYMEKLLLAQTELQELKFEKNYVGQGLTEFSPLGTVISNSAKTLNYVQLNLSPPDREFMDGTLFSNCFSLQTLIIQGASRAIPFRFRHVTRLPESLRHLRLHLPLHLLPAERLEYLKFPNLEQLVLDYVVFQSPKEYKHLERTEFVRNALRMRRLARLEISAFEVVCDSSKPSLELNMMVNTIRGDAPEGRYSFLNIYGHELKARETSFLHFLDSDPFERAQVDPKKKFRILSEQEEIQANALDSVIIKSSMSKTGPQICSRSGDIAVSLEQDAEEEEEPWCDFCHALFSID